MQSGCAILIVDDDADIVRAARLALGPVAGRIEAASSLETLAHALRPMPSMSCCWI